jgi:hypothetical protein
MADYHDVLLIERMSGRQRPYVVHGSGDIVKGPRPAAAWIVDTTILDIPGRHPRLRQGACQRGHEIKTGEFGYPATTVNDDRHGMRPFSLRHSQFAELEWTDSIVNTLIGW